MQVSRWFTNLKIPKWEIVYVHNRRKIDCLKRATQQVPSHF